MYDYDLIVIGAGSGGLTSSLIAAEIGLNVALIDKEEERVGGECLWSGCVPSKALIHVAKKIYASKKVSSFGVETKGETSWDSVKEYIQRKQRTIKKHESKEELEKQGVSLLFGTAKLEGKNKVCVDGQTVTAKKIILATGSSPRRLGLETQIPIYTNEEIFTMDSLPKEILVIGGGPIGLELGQSMSRLGSKVTVIERGNRILKRDPADLTTYLKKILQEENISIKLNTSIEAIHKEKVTLSDDTVHTPDAILLGIGRTPNIENIGLDEVGVEYSKTGIKVNDYCQTNINSIYAVGDCNGQYQLSHAAEIEATTVLQNNLIPLYNKKVPYNNMSWVTYTDPQIATLGDIEDLEKTCTKHRMPFNETDRTIIESTPSRGFLYEKKGYIKGASILHTRADSLIQEIILAKQNKIKLKEFMNKIVPYPTHEMATKLTAVKHVQRKTPRWIKKLGGMLW